MTNNQSVTVLDANGHLVGTTYPKRAKGLIKKGRAEALTENCIRLSGFRPQDLTTEEIEMNDININEKTVNTQQNETVEKTDSKSFIFFTARDWHNGNSGYPRRYIIDHPVSGRPTEIYSLGDWNGRACIISKNYPIVSKNTSFVFWLNGGENDRFNETCELAVYFSNGEDNALSQDTILKDGYIFRLNRGHIKPLKYVNGWYLFEISLPETDCQFAALLFNSQNAPMAVASAEKPEAYADIPDTVDEFADRRPQRHNILFADGWPDDRKGQVGNWYSTGNLRRQREAGIREDGRWQGSYPVKRESVEKAAENSATFPDFGPLFERLEKMKGLTGDFVFNGEKIFDFKELNDFVNVAKKMSDAAGQAVRSRDAEELDEIISDLEPFCQYDMAGNINPRDVRDMLTELSDILKGGLRYDMRDEFSDKLDRAYDTFRPATSGKAFVNGKSLKVLFQRFKTFRNKMLHRLGAASSSSGMTADIEEIAEHISENIDMGELASALADTIDTDDLAENLAEYIDFDEIAENVDVDEIAEKVADNIYVDEIAEKVTENIDTYEIAEKLSESIDLDDLADKIIERLDIKSLLRDMLDED